MVETAAILRPYETILVCPGDLSQEKLDQTVEKVKALITRADGKIHSVELWGRRKLVFPIRRSRDGFYVYILFSAPPQVPGEIRAHLKVTDTILRALTLQVDPKQLEKTKAAPKTSSEATAKQEEPEAAAPPAPDPVQPEAPS